MRVVFVLTYYWPHLGGVATHVKRLAEAMASRGHKVTVLTSHHSQSLPATECINGVEIVRVPVLTRIARSPFMPTFTPYAMRLIRKSDVVSVHIPLVEAGFVCLLARLLRKPVILRYHCDFEPLPGRWWRVAALIPRAMNLVAASCSDRIVPTTEDYVNNSELLTRYRHKLRVVPPAATAASVDPTMRQRFIERFNPDRRPVIAMAARMAPEKGVEYLLQAIPYLLPHYPELRVMLTGEARGDIGCDGYFRRLQPIIDRYRDHIVFLGVLDSAEMPAFFASADVLVTASVSGAEAFGMVQVEAMLCGTPVVATNLPGVRESVRKTGMGLLVPPRDPGAIADAVRSVIDNRLHYHRSRQEVERHFDSDGALLTEQDLLANPRG